MANAWCLLGTNKCLPQCPYVFRWSKKKKYPPPLQEEKILSRMFSGRWSKKKKCHAPPPTPRMSSAGPRRKIKKSKKSQKQTFFITYRKTAQPPYKFLVSYMIWYFLKIDIVGLFIEPFSQCGQSLHQLEWSFRIRFSQYCLRIQKAKYSSKY